ncbi:MAG: type II toxin-antitoxin system ParD family antitoxin [Azospirillaceae bacterium]|nr:type II toxin-antitoxin system ParD family antitoxin [Azospirillaceae bacterium]
MPDIVKRSVTLSPEWAAYADSLVAAGAYASVADVLRAGLAALKDRGSVDRWRQAGCQAGSDAAMDMPSPILPAKDPFDAIRAHQVQRLKSTV